MPSPSSGTDPAPNADTDADASKLHALLLAAASEVVGPSLANEVFSITRERPMRTPAGSSSPSPRTPAADFRCHAPVTLFRRLLARATRRPPPRSPNDGDGVRTRNADETLTNLFVSEKEDAVETSEKVASLGEGEIAVFADADYANDVTVNVVTVSSYGTVRARAFASAEALADAVVEAADPTALGALVADVRVEKSNRRGDGTLNPGSEVAVTRARDEPPAATTDGERSDDDEKNAFVPGESENENETMTKTKQKKRRRPSKLGGELRFVTAKRILDARASDLLLCRSCGFFLQGDKGLREHSQVRHGASYEASLERVADARNALVVFEGVVRSDAATKRSADQNETEARIDVCETTSLAAARAKTLRARESLPVGLRFARDGLLSSLRALVSDTGWDPTGCDSVDANGSCALHWAAGRGRLAICKFLVHELGENPRRAQNRDGRTAMHWAARNGRVETLRWLVTKCGVSVDEATNDGTTPFMWCVWGGGGAEVEASETKTTEKEENKTKDEDVVDSDEDVVDFAGALSFLTSDAKCDVHATNAFGCNASQWAAQRKFGSVAMCLYLQNVGVDLKVTNGNGHSAIHKAAVKGNRAACEWLLGAGGLGLPHLNADGDGNTPGEMARLEGHEDLAAWLFEKTRTLEGERSLGA
jgi:ankyrin repeat protein